MKLNKWLRRALFAAGGALAGLAYYRFIGCPAGSCAITSNPVSSMLYMAFVGLLLSGIFGKECSKCNM